MTFSLISYCDSWLGYFMWAVFLHVILHIITSLFLSKCCLLAWAILQCPLHLLSADLYLLYIYNSFSVSWHITFVWLLTLLLELARLCKGWPMIQKGFHKGWTHVCQYQKPLKTSRIFDDRNWTEALKNSHWVFQVNLLSMFFIS